jgi:hypothetical protein
MRKASYNHHDIIRYLRYLQEYLLLQIKWEGNALRCKALSVALGRIIAAKELLSWRGDTSHRGLALAVKKAMQRSKDTPLVFLPDFTICQAEELDNVVRCLGIRRARASAPVEVGYVVLGVFRPKIVIQTRKGGLRLVLVPNRECFLSLAEREHCYCGLNGHRARLHG